MGNCLYRIQKCFETHPKARCDESGNSMNKKWVRINGKFDSDMASFGQECRFSLMICSDREKRFSGGTLDRISIVEPCIEAASYISSSNQASEPFQSADKTRNA